MNRYMKRLEKYLRAKFHILASRVPSAVAVIGRIARTKWTDSANSSIPRYINHAEVNYCHGNARVSANPNFATGLRVLI